MTESPRSDAGRCSRPDSSRPSRQESSPAGPARGATVRRSARGAAAVRVSVTRRVGPRGCPGPAAAPSTGPTGALWRSTTGGASRERRRPHAVRAALTTPGRAPESTGVGVARERRPRAVERRPVGVRHRSNYALESLCRLPHRRVLDESPPSVEASPFSPHTAPAGDASRPPRRHRRHGGGPSGCRGGRGCSALSEQFLFVTAGVPGGDPLPYREPARGILLQVARCLEVVGDGDEHDTP